MPKPPVEVQTERLTQKQDESSVLLRRGHVHRKVFAAQSDMNAEGKSNYTVQTALIVQPRQHSAERSPWLAGCCPSRGKKESEAALDHRGQQPAGGFMIRKPEQRACLHAPEKLSFLHKAHVGALAG